MRLRSPALPRTSAAECPQSTATATPPRPLAVPPRREGTVAVIAAIAMVGALSFVAFSLDGGLLLDKPNTPVAALFYALYVAGVLVFAVLPALDAGQWSRALLHGALFGFFAYATYDLTNLATLKGWTPSVALLDLAWGTVVTGVSATAGCLVTRSAF